ncbi:riboflavin kinase, partial [Candidatus Gottesmanbacteria bacterium]|nr:riboflavin kinase [Candidatus Gottesmanbacteria bacterium]
MKITSRQIKGKGRGKLLGFPTINLEIPEGLTLKEGIWAVWVTIAGKRYGGALHFGPVPTFREREKSLEVFLLDASEAELAGVESA